MLKYSFQVLTKALSHIQIVTLRAVIRYNVNMVLEKRRISTAIEYKKCAQISVLSVNESPIRYAFRKATESYTV